MPSRRATSKYSHENMTRYKAGNNTVFSHLIISKRKEH